MTTKYVYGLGLIGEEKDSLFKTYHFDNRGSTVAITNEGGTITDRLAYDTYGKLISHTGTSFVIFGYNGRDGVVTDRNGLIYMRARYYSPAMKRFVNADVVAGAISNAITLNRYAYANGNPVTNVDPFGLSAERGSSGGVVSQFFSDIGSGISWFFGKIGEGVSTAWDYLTNDDEEVVLNADAIAFYKGKVVLKVPIGTDAFSFGIIFLGDEITAEIDGVNTVRHEYGHTQQLDKYGLTVYTSYVAIPSLACYWGNAIGLLDDDIMTYYSRPYEYEADKLGGAERDKPYKPWAEKTYRAYSTAETIVSSQYRASPLTYEHVTVLY